MAILIIEDEKNMSDLLKLEQLNNHLLQPVAHLPYPLLHHEQLT